MRFNRLIFGLFLMLAFVGVASSAPYTILTNGSATDMYVYTASGGDYIIREGGAYSAQPTQVFEKQFEDDWDYMLPLINGAPVPRAATNCTTPTSDGSGMIVHPAVIDFGLDWQGYRYWMAVTGYYDLDAYYENPHLLASADKTTWVVPTGVTNPISPNPGGSDFNSDPGLVYDDENDQLIVYWRTTYIGNDTRMFSAVTYDGETVSSPVAVITSDSSFVEVSPSVEKVNGVYHWWTCVQDMPNVLSHRMSDDGLEFSEPDFVQIISPEGTAPSGAPIWHPDIRFIPEKNIWLMLGYASTGGDNAGYLQIGESDTVSGPFTLYPSPVLAKCDRLGTWDKQLYKSSVQYDDSTGKLNIWYTGENSTSSPKQGYLGYTEYDYDDLMTYVRNSPFGVYQPTADNINASVAAGVLYVQTAVNQSMFYTANGTAGSHILCNASSNLSGSIGLRSGSASAFQNTGEEFRSLSTFSPYFFSKVGNGATGTIAYSQTSRDTAFHYFEHYHGNTTIDGNETISNYANGRVSQAVENNWGLWFMYNLNVDWIATTNRNIVSSELVPSDDGLVLSGATAGSIIRIPATEYTKSQQFSIYKFADAETGDLYVGKTCNITESGLIIYEEDILPTDTVVPSFVSSDAGDLVVEVSEWSNTRKVWTESSENHTAATTHTITGLPSRSRWTLSRDGVAYEDPLDANAAGVVTWTYTGGFSEHEFELVPLAGYEVRSENVNANNDSIVNIWGTIVGFASVIAVLSLATIFFGMWQGKISMKTGTAFVIMGGMMTIIIGIITYVLYLVLGLGV